MTDCALKIEGLATSVAKRQGGSPESHAQVPVPDVKQRGCARRPNRYGHRPTFCTAPLVSLLHPTHLLIFKFPGEGEL